MAGDYALKEIKTLKEWFKELGKMPDYWIYRGKCYPPKTSLERACEDSGIDVKESAKIEGEMIREFRRWYDGNDKDSVTNDTLYCLSLMQHYGAPTRMLDWTYSKYVAAYFALESAKDQRQDCKNGKNKNIKNCVIWCLNTEWCKEETEKKVGKQKIRDISSDKKRREDTTFTSIFKIGKPYARAYRFVLPQNPLQFHSRLYMQQSILVCPGDVSVSFENNLRMPGWEKAENIIKVVFEMTQRDLENGLEQLWRMDLSRATLFTGLDGYAQSMRYRTQFFKKLYNFRHNTKKRGI